MDLRTEMGGYIQSVPNTKRFVVEDSITKVTSDGEPHGMMTMVAGLSGLLAAIIILAVLVSMVTCRKQKSNASRKSNSSANVVAMTSVAQDQPQLAGNLNAAFAESTLTLDKVKQGTEDQWRPTSVVVERY
ncbi:uncharacterized protein LOC6525000 [Drosophila yakuba]|uniref:Uncharacterized protein, isoform B n=1 Tax=Drosophila yakuba TaxID=7245 RepID=B4PXW2_DROYA|nr:uncharacterized protein LOC6525000 [Drosophila yakuba]XP_015046036.1 uncharacterized protein LOC6525000 [Drosophila yakuba]XP_015046037.1 uncharacterized protein LOC6525000 [Drosophila yakuba]EDX01948.2 uncharacterized protein Dyak_GE15952, isoform D [Drosophila yakuba]KRK06476.1 uncharacterized protein Dyak_GE15952, isoform B [Drosophila yakuba]KRK06477.1 uncharacterized protein Dyak_GE15952, isoform C [Drosophila yakuba]KRK06478.1 uncharacterized protein Dyak_GE15952, isoform E [Drosophi